LLHLLLDIKPLEPIRARLLDPSWLDTAAALVGSLAIVVGEAKTLAEALGRPKMVERRLIGLCWPA
jgi:hypothetical protein